MNGLTDYAVGLEIDAYSCADAVGEKKNAKSNLHLPWSRKTGAEHPRVTGLWLSGPCSAVQVTAVDACTVSDEVDGEGWSGTARITGYIIGVHRGGRRG